MSQGNRPKDIKLPKASDLFVVFVKDVHEDVYGQMRFIPDWDMDRLRTYLLDFERQEGSSSRADEGSALMTQGSRRSNGAFPGKCNHCGKREHTVAECWKAGGGEEGQGPSFPRGRNSGQIVSPARSKRDERACFNCNEKGHIRR